MAEPCDIGDWLARVGLGKYTEVFRENEIDLVALPHLTDGDLKEIGVALGARRKLLAAIPAIEPGTTSTRVVQAGADTRVPDGERRQLTVVFSDLVGSTDLAQSLDPEHLGDVLHRYQDTIGGVVTRHGGYVAKFLGDGVLAYFGWPRAHEDQAQRAVQAALDCVAAVGDLPAAGESELHVRVGIATGQVVIGEIVNETAGEAAAVSGSTPNLAARLQSAAASDEVVVDPTTRRLVGGTFLMEERGPERLKGFREPVESWRVISPAAVGSRFDAAHEGRITNFVGRREEVALLLGRWRQAEGGEGQAVLLSGEPGIGKSRILLELEAHLAGRRHETLRFQCAPHQTSAAFHPLADHIARTAEIRTNDDNETRLDKLEALLQADGDARHRDGALIAGLLGLPTARYPELGLTAQKQKSLTIDLLVARVETLCRDAAVLILVEDVHWMDPSSLEWLDALIERVRELPALLVITHRPEFENRWNGQGHVTVQSLNRLGRGDARALTEQVTGGDRLPEDVLAEILKRTDGVPLFVEELTRTVLEAGVSNERDGGSMPEGGLPVHTIPVSLNDSLMSRLDRLGEVKEVVQAAACIGRDFDADLLDAVVSMPGERLSLALEKVVASGLVHRRHGGDGVGYQFKHALVRDAAYESLLKSTRRKIHAKLAHALRTRQASPSAVVLAYHLAAAGEVEAAAAAYLQAGQQALAASALDEAVSALESGLEQVAKLDAGAARDRLELEHRMALGTACMAKFGWPHPSVAEALEPAFPLAAERLEDPRALGPILWGLWVHYQTRTRFKEARAWLERLDALARTSGDPELLAVRDMSSGCQCFWEADYRRAAVYTEHVRGAYDETVHARIVSYANHDPLCFSLHWAGSLLEWITGHPDRALARLDEALDLARRRGHPFNTAFALTAGSQALVMLGGGERLLSHCEEAERIIADQGLGGFAENSMLNQWRGQAHVVLGDHARGLALLQRGNTVFNEAGGRICNAMWWCVMAEALMGLHRSDEARTLLTRALAHCRDTGDRYMEPEVLRLRAAAGGDVDGDALLNEAIAVARAREALSWELRAATDLAARWAETGHRTDARALLEPIHARFTEGHETQDLKAATRLLESVS